MFCHVDANTLGTDGRKSMPNLKIVQSTLVISKSKGLSKILRDIRTSTY